MTAADTAPKPFDPEKVEVDMERAAADGLTKILRPGQGRPWSTRNHNYDPGASAEFSLKVGFSQVHESGRVLVPADRNKSDQDPGRWFRLAECLAVRDRMIAEAAALGVRDYKVDVYVRYSANVGTTWQQATL